jgi:hypothetical protein
MNLTKFDDLFNPINTINSSLDYKNINGKDKYNIIVKNKKLIHEFNSDIDQGILHSINYYNNLNCFVIFGKKKTDSYNYYTEHFKDDYSLYGIKYMSLNSSIIPKIMYQLLFSRMIIKTKYDLYNTLESDYKYLYKYIEDSLDKSIDITVLIVCKKDLSRKYPMHDVHANDFFIYIPNTKDSIWNCASVFFCESTLKFLDLQNFDFFLTKDNEPSKKMFLKYRNWINENIDIKDRSQFMLFSSVVLYLLGHRGMNDLDLYIHTVSNETIEKLDTLKSNELFNFLEFKVKNTSNWPNYWNTWLDSWAQKSGAKYFEEILGNPRFHFYFLGVKVISLDCDVVRRIERNRPRAVADLIALKKRYQYKVLIPSIPEKSIKYIHIDDKSEEDIKKLIDEGGILNELNKEISMETIVEQSKFISTIIYALQTRYKMIFTIDEIKRELNMIGTKKIFREPLKEDAKKIKVVIKKKTI